MQHQTLQKIPLQYHQTLKEELILSALVINPLIADIKSIELD